ncbi:DUF3102 domain-containing protein [Salmonella enterica]|nr:DUF3102 domain-containing protein [Salmonella enterica]EKP2121565.1 DUF3102 domain-containing protein [Salmonella enterica]EKP2131119.1 DUF3102 domain-containing protein [Salmonella enterica]EKP2153626.1 DUF3102 domain-containing protein [Salmonella enterica]
MATNKFNHSDTTNQADTISSLLAKGDTTQEEIMDLIRVGIQLHFIKDNSPHGEFMSRLTELGVAHRTAIDAMRIALKFGQDNTPRAAIAKTGIGKTKLILLARLDEAALDLLASGGAYNDHTLDDIRRMSARELQRVIQSGEDINCERTLTNKTDAPSLSVEDESDKEAEIKQSGQIEGNKKQYCRELLKVALRYSGITELSAITKFIEHMIACSLAEKYSPGLNAASYEVYNKFVINRRSAK